MSVSGESVPSLERQQWLEQDRGMMRYQPMIRSIAASAAAMQEAKAARLFQAPMRCSSPTIVSMLSGTLMRAETNQRTAAAIAATAVSILTTRCQSMVTPLRGHRNVIYPEDAA
jgi:hypothetical protein